MTYRTFSYCADGTGGRNFSRPVPTGRQMFPKFVSTYYRHEPHEWPIYNYRRPGARYVFAVWSGAAAAKLPGEPLDRGVGWRGRHHVTARYARLAPNIKLWITLWISTTSRPSVDNSVDNLPWTMYRPQEQTIKGKSKKYNKIILLLPFYLLLLIIIKNSKRKRI